MRPDLSLRIKPSIPAWDAVGLSAGSPSSLSAPSRPPDSVSGAGIRLLSRTNLAQDGNRSIVLIGRIKSQSEVRHDTFYLGGTGIRGRNAGAMMVGKRPAAARQTRHTGKVAVRSERSQTTARSAARGGERTCSAAAWHLQQIVIAAIRGRGTETMPPWREREMPSAESKVLTTRRGYWPTIRTH